MEYVGPNQRIRPISVTPPARAFHTSAFEITRNVDVIFGGVSGSGTALGVLTTPGRHCVRQRSGQTLTTWSASTERSTSIARQSRVNSSITLSILIVRPLARVSNWTSSAAHAREHRHALR